MSKLAGVIFPVPANLINGLFNGGSKIFVKYISHNSTRLVEGNKIVFNESRGSQSLIGEGIINSIEFLTPNEVLNNYKDLLFLDFEQFDSYVKLWPNRDPLNKMLTVKLTKMRKYVKPIKCEKPITMAGRYVNMEEYKKLFIEEN